MARTPTKVTAAALEQLEMLAARARQADARAAAEWAAAYDAVARLSRSREMTIAAAAEALGVSEATLNRALAQRRRSASKS